MYKIYALFTNQGSVNDVGIEISGFLIEKSKSMSTTRGVISSNVLKIYRIGSLYVKAEE